MRKIGNGIKGGAQPGVELFGFLLKLRDLLAKLLSLRDQRLGVLLLLFELRYLLGGAVALGLELFGAGDGLPARGIK